MRWRRLVAGHAPRPFPAKKHAWTADTLFHIQVVYAGVLPPFPVPCNPMQIRTHSHT